MNARTSVRIWCTLAGMLATAMPSLAADNLTVHKRLRAAQADGSFKIVEQIEQWKPAETAVIVCDMWDLHHCLNAVRRAQEMAPRMNQVLESAREKGVTIIHAPSSCMDAYEQHPGRARAKAAATAGNLPSDIAEWCRQIPAEESAKYPIDQTDGGEDDDPIEHTRWHERLAGMGRNPRSPWKRQIELLRIDDRDAISDSGVEIWNLLEERGIRNVILLGVHTNMCVLGRPFGLRQMAKNGKNVVLMRDLTDTMYNPERWPYVTHFVGTDRIVEHIEKYVCSTITSVDVLNGSPFRFKNDRRSIVLLIGEDEYETDRTLPEFARTELTPRGFDVRIVRSDPANPHQFPGMESGVRNADLVLVSVRRRAPATEQLDALRAHVAAGKPIVGIRTASHAFALRGANATVPTGHATWPEFDAAVLGGHYVGHHGDGMKPAVRVAPGANEHPTLRGIAVDRLSANGSLYRVVPLAASTSPLLVGSIAGQPAEPLAWTNVVHGSGSRVFYTSLGHIDDFANAGFRKLLLNGICWTLDIAAPGSTP